MIRTFGYSHPELPRVEVPVGGSCDWCRETFVAADLGVVVPHVGSLPRQHSAVPGDRFLGKNHDPDQIESQNSLHRECFIRQIVGSVAHQKRTCRCFGGTDAEIDGDLSPRQAAIAADAIFHLHLAHGFRKELPS